MLGCFKSGTILKIINDNYICNIKKRLLFKILLLQFKSMHNLAKTTIKEELIFAFPYHFRYSQKSVKIYRIPF